jgi:hypothetical protein
MNKGFEKQWQSALENAEVRPPLEVWEGIEHYLDNQSETKVLPFWYSWKTASIAASLALLMLAFWKFNVSDNKKSSVISQNTTGNPVGKELKTPAKVGSSAFSIPENNLQQNLINLSKGPKVLASEFVQKLNIKKANSGVFEFSTNSQVRSESEAVAFLDKDFVLESPSTTDIQLNTETSLLNRTLNLDVTLLNSKKPRLLGTRVILDRKYLPLSDLKNGDFAEASKSKKNKIWLGLNSSIGNSDSPFSINQINSVALASLNDSPEIAFGANSLGVLNTPSKTNNFALPFLGVNQGRSSSWGIELGKKIKSGWSLISGLRIQISRNPYEAPVLANVSNTREQSTVLERILSKNNAAKDYYATSTRNSTYTLLDAQNSISDLDYNYLQVPLAMAYELPLGSKVKLEMQAGLSTDVLLSANSSTENFSEKVNFTASNSIFKSMNISGLAGVNLGFNLNESWQAVLGTRFQNALQSGTETDLKFKPRSFGVNYGLRYKM